MRYFIPHLLCTVEIKPGHGKANISIHTKPRAKTKVKCNPYDLTRGSRGLVVRHLLGMREVLGSNPFRTKTLCWFLLCSHFLSSKLLSNVCHSSKSLRAIIVKQGFKTSYIFYDLTNIFFSVFALQIVKLIILSSTCQFKHASLSCN